MLTRELLDRFKKLYEEEFGVIITDEEATKMATDLVNLMKILVKPLPNPENKKSDPQEPEQGLQIHETI